MLLSNQMTAQEANKNKVKATNENHYKKAFKTEARPQNIT